MTRRQPTSSRRFSLAVLAGLLALVLQVLTPALPTSVMVQAMDLAATSPDEAASFSATCLGLGNFDPGNPATPGQHGKCPICISMAQANAFLPAPALSITAVTWARATPPRPASVIIKQAAASPFASRAPPIA